MYLCQKLRGVSYVNYVLTCIICFILSRSVWSSSRFADQWFGELWEWRDLFIQTKPKKKKKDFFKKKLTVNQASNTMATSSVNGGSPFDSQSLGSCSLKLAGEPTLRLVKSSQEAGQCSSSCKGRAGGRSISILSSVLREKPQGAEKAAWGWKRLLLAIFSCFCIWKKTQQYFSEESGFSASWESLLGKGNLLVGKNFWRRINSAQERDESQQGSGGEWS